MEQLAKAKLMSFAIKVPQNWQEPTGDAAKMYARAFKPEERVTAPGMPPLFQPASLNKYHTDTQKMHIGKIGEYIKGITSAICSAWSQWQTAASLVGVIVNGPVASGGSVVGPPMLPFIMASAPMASPQELKYTNVIAQVISTAWLQFTATIKVTAMPWYPAFAMFPGPVAPPMPNIPCPVAALMQVDASIQPMVLKSQMVGQLGDPQAPLHPEIFESVADAFNQCYLLWKVSTMVTNVLGTGPVPTFAPPYVPVGPVVGGVGNMTPGGFV